MKPLFKVGQQLQHVKFTDLHYLVIEFITPLEPNSQPEYLLMYLGVYSPDKENKPFSVTQKRADVEWELCKV